MHQQRKEYYLSVEGKTEQWYFEWLQRMVGKTVAIRCTTHNPLKCVRNLKMVQPTEIMHVTDYEGANGSEHFYNALDSMKKATLGKSIQYALGYSNLTFELWLLLHKTDYNTSLTRRDRYIKPIRDAFSVNFENLDEYKEERNFKSILQQLTLNNVREAIQRAKAITKRNQDNDYKLLEYKGYKYYAENPSLSVHEVVEKIIAECV